MNIKHGIFFLQMMIAMPIVAQEQLALSAGDITRLAIAFAPVMGPDQQTGSRFPATVVISPNATSIINSSFGGTLLEWHANPGDQLAQGAAIASIRSIELLNIQSQWLAIDSELELASFEVERDQRLFEQGIVSEQRLQQTRNKFQQIQYEHVGYAEQLQHAGFERSALDALRQGNTSLGVYQVRAPVSGVLTHRAYTTGAIVGAYAELASLQQNNAIWLSAEIPARLAAQLPIGFELGLEGSADMLIVRHKDLVVEEMTQTVEVLAEFTNNVSYQPGRILTLVLPPQGDGVLIPANAVVHSGDSTTVYVRTPEGVEIRRLTLEPAGFDYLARSGIRAGEEVVIRGTAALKGMQLGLGQSE